MKENKDYNCDICNNDMEIREVGILASLDDSCSPQSVMVCYCKKCMEDRLMFLLSQIGITQTDDLENKLLPYENHEDYQEIRLLLKAFQYAKDR